jgi:Lipase (class 3)
MRYDPSATALFHPEAQGPLFGAQGRWSREANCAELSRLAYIHFEDGPAGVEELGQALERGGFQSPATFHDATTDAEGFGTVGADGTAFIAFRGTQPDRAKDIACDADAVTVAWPEGGRVHRGFKRALDSLMGAVGAWLHDRNAPRLVITGHSLGAAMATLLAAKIEGADLVTFGSPRVGTADFTGLIGPGRVWRFVDCCDGVTRLPPAVGYRHLEGERYIDRNGRILASPPGFIARNEDRVRGALTYIERCIGPDNVPARELADHAPVNYLSALLGVREGP